MEARRTIGAPRRGRIGIGRAKARFTSSGEELVAGQIVSSAGRPKLPSMGPVARFSSKGLWRSRSGKDLLGCRASSETFIDEDAPSNASFLQAISPRFRTLWQI